MAQIPETARAADMQLVLSAGGPWMQCPVFSAGMALRSTVYMRFKEMKTAMTFEKYLKEVYPRYMPEMTRTKLMDLAAAAIVSDDCTMGFYVDHTEKKFVYHESGFGPAVDLYMILLAIQSTYLRLCIEYPDQDFDWTAARMIDMIRNTIKEEDING